MRIPVALSIPGAAQAGHGDKYRGGIVTPPLPKPAFILTDTSGAPYDFQKRTEGSLTLLFFGYTSCPDACPMHMANIGVALKKLPPGISGRVKLVFVTTDPERDTAVALRRWLDHFDPLFIGLTGTEAALDAVQKSAGVPPARRTDCATATIQSPTPTSSSPTPEIIWPT